MVVYRGVNAYPNYCDLFSLKDTGDIVNRRGFITLLAGVGFALPSPVEAQRVPKIPVVGFLHPGFPDAGSVAFDALREGIRNTGYIEGETIKLETRWAHGRPEMLPKLTQELVELPVDILFATARPSIEAARAATTAIPIIANDLESDPI